MGAPMREWSSATMGRMRPRRSLDGFALSALGLSFLAAMGPIVSLCRPCYQSAGGAHGMNDQTASLQTAGLAEAREFRTRHPAIRHFDAFFIDICGRPRGKRCPIDKLESLYEEGIQSPQSHFLLDVNGDTSNPLGRGFSDGDPDTTLVPVPGSLAPVPWSKPPLAQVIV